MLYPVGPGTDRPFNAVGARGQMGIVTQQYIYLYYIFVHHSFGLIEVFCFPDSPEHRYCDNHKVLNYRIYTCSNTERMPCILVSRSSTSRHFKEIVELW